MNQTSKQHIIKVLPRQKMPVGSEGLLYSCDVPLPIGAVVRINLRGRPILGVVDAIDQQLPGGFKLKQATPTDLIIPNHLVSLQRWVATKHNTGLGSAVSLVVPQSMPLQRTIKPTIDTAQVEIKPLKLNAHQATISQAIKSSTDQNHLVHGVTGSGKTQVYIDLIDHTARNQNRSSILLVPEIGLSRHLAKALASCQLPIIELNSSLTTAEKSRRWHQVAAATAENQAVLVIGPRSALFAPVHNLGLVVIDEQHDNSFSQDTKPYYRAQSTASELCRLSNAKLVMGSATPDIVTYHQFMLKGLPIHTLNQKAVTGAKEPKIIVHTKQSGDRSKIKWLSRTSLKLLEQSIAKGEQTLIFHNRRGSYPVITCDECGSSPVCVCGNHLVAYGKPLHLSCHICGRKHDPPRQCPTCASLDLSYRGLGIDRIVSDLARHFAETPIAKIDSQSKPDGSVLQSVRDGSTKLIVGTQSVTQGYDLAHLRQIVIPDFEHLLNHPDPYSEERLFRTITQLRGRIGRHSDNDRLVIEARPASLPKLELLLASNYHDFYQSELERRRELGLPPFFYSLLVRCEYVNANRAVSSQIDFIQSVSQTLPAVTIKGPAVLSRKTAAGKTIAQSLLLAKSMTALQTAADLAPSNFKLRFEPRQLL